MDAAMTVLSQFNVPVIFDADIGHKEPQWTIINGAKARFEYNDGKASLTYLE
jgi:muramoyltetrapeptide carboxypeptidase LdcA involved in peptidoglycan recycling